MSKQTVLGIVLLVLSQMCLLAFFAQRDTYQRFAEGFPVEATVERLSGGAVLLSYTAENGRPVNGVSSDYVSAEQAAQLRPGQTVAALQMRGVPARATLRDSLEQARPAPVLLPLTTMLLLGSLVLVWPRPPARTPLSSAELVAGALRRSRATSLVLGLGLTAFGLFLIWLPLSGLDTTSDFGPLWVVVVGGLVILPSLVTGVFLLRQAWRLRRIGGSRLFAALAHQPEQIIWAYEFVAKVRYAGGRQSVVMVWFNDGGQDSLFVSADDARELLSDIARRAPGAHIGYDAAVEARVRAGRR
ncbi:MAG TPA: hypothetical protein VFS21_25925 [Roseiflexaceae bacterium]|nr:hypothetical protein [Roseiflexaceae bacterium]